MSPPVPTLADMSTQSPRTQSPPCTPPPTREPAGRVETLIDRFLEEQANPTAVERFARDHDAGQLPAARRYQSLMPATPPGPDQQYGFDVDLDVCTGCKACVTACRSLNGLDDEETWRSVGLVVGRSANDPVQQHVTTACHHCVDPGCLSGCPVDAYEKDPDTGIVLHDEDQCIGCGYCVFACPYEVPRFNHDRGVVRKCDLCADRLTAGEAPACVQACPTHAISVRLVDSADARAAADEPWPVTAPDPALTVPTTTYRSEHELTAEPADHSAPVPGGAHPPLAVMLVFTQVAVGAHLVDLATGASPAGAVAALLAGGAGLAASLAHLGRPRYAYRAVIGLRHSWLSREIVALTAFMGLLGADTAMRVTGTDTAFTAGLAVATAAAGVAGVVCSVMVYAVTGRRWWALRPVGARFALTTLAGGLATLLALEATVAWVAGGEADAGPAPFAIALAAATTVRLAVDMWPLRRAWSPRSDELVRSAVLLAGPLRGGLRWRLVLGVIGGVALPLWAALILAGSHEAGPAAVASWVALGSLLAGELVERWQFFTAASPRGMPGGLR